VLISLTYNLQLHFIVRHENPLDHTIEEKHLVPRPRIKTDKLTHLYTLHVRKDNSFEISIDQEVVKAGNLLQDILNNTESAELE
jgi:calnexin